VDALTIASLIGLGESTSAQPTAARAERVSCNRLHHFITAESWDAALFDEMLAVETVGWSVT
jgi:hypothetical protein